MSGLANRLRSALAVAIALMAGDIAAPAAQPTLLAEPGMPGPASPPSGRSLFDELFATAEGHDVPYPFERLVEALNARIAPERVRTALIPLGRSLQRYAAHPDYFASPRLVLAVDAEGAATTGEALMRDRLFLGYQPAAAAIEVISYNESGGRFEFQRVTDYDGRARPQVGYVGRDACVGCHQGHGPIFPRPLWSETNANPAIAARLTGLGETYHGAPVRQGIDGPDGLDQSADRAGRIAAVNRLWDEGCGDGIAGSRCRAALLTAALKYRLGGARVDWQSAELGESIRLQQRLTELWPAGLAIPTPDLPNRDPLAPAALARTAGDILDASGADDPLQPRAPSLQWTASADATATFNALARDIAGMFASADIAWIDARLAAPEPAQSISYQAVCSIDQVDREPGGAELRFECGEPGGELLLDGYVTTDGPRIDGGRIDALAVAGERPIRLLRVVGGSVTGDAGSRVMHVVAREAGTGLNARLQSTLRLTGILLKSSAPQLATAEVGLADELDAFDGAIQRMVDAGAIALKSGPLRRRAVMADLHNALSAQ